MAKTGAFVCVQAVLVLLFACMAAADDVHAPTKRLEGATGTVSATFVCPDSNDVWKIVSKSQAAPTAAVTRVDTAEEGISTAPQGSALLVLASGYPTTATKVTEAQLAAAMAKGLRVYLEFPAALPGAVVQAPTLANYYHRVVVANDDLSPFGLPKLSILMAQGSYFTDVTGPPATLANSSLVYDKVAGVSTAVFGLTPAAQQNALLFPYTLPGARHAGAAAAGGKLLVAVTKLSQIVTARYAPTTSWAGVWSYIMCSLGAIPAASCKSLGAAAFPAWEPLVHPFATATEPLAPTARAGALDRAVTWLSSASGLLTTDKSKCPAPLAAPGASVTCMLEGFSSKIDWNGTQQLASDVRMDCNAESAMGLAVGALALGRSNHSVWLQQAGGLLDYVYFQSIAQQGIRANASNPAYGLIAWGVSSPAWSDRTYGDDDARVLFGSLVASTVLGTNRWDASILKAMLANLRTSSRFGFRPGAIEFATLESKGWEYYFQADATYDNTDRPQPHYQSFLWGVYVWAYHATGFQPFLDHAEAGLGQTMAHYGPKWRWTEYESEELAHMLLPLSWLYRVTGNATHKAWLDTMASAYVKHQQPTGCVQEFLGTPGYCSTCPPSDNSEYGDGEAPLIQDNGDTVSDLLYSNNFALVGLIEAAGATGSAELDQAAQSLAECLTRCQAVSTTLPQVNGAYMRAFDYEKWDFWGSSADWGWGPWSVETGWTQGWISLGLALGLMNNGAGTTMWDLTSASTIDGALLRTLCPSFFPPGSGVSCPQ